MATKLRAELVSVSKLSAAVDRAVKIAADRHQVTVSDVNLVNGWDLIGRRLRDADLAHKFSIDVAAALKKELGITVQPATLLVGKQILCGFVEKNRAAERDLL